MFLVLVGNIPVAAASTATIFELAFVAIDTPSSVSPPCLFSRRKWRFQPWVGQWTCFSQEFRTGLHHPSDWWGSRTKPTLHDSVINSDTLRRWWYRRISTLVYFSISPSLLPWLLIFFVGVMIFVGWWKEKASTPSRQHERNPSTTTPYIIASTATCTTSSRTTTSLAVASPPFRAALIFISFQSLSHILTSYRQTHTQTHTHAQAHTHTHTLTDQNHMYHPPLPMPRPSQNER